MQYCEDIVKVLPSRTVCIEQPVPNIVNYRPLCRILCYVLSFWQGVLSWRASGDRQISLSASAERAFANFRVKNVVFTGTHFCAVLSMAGERVFVNFRKFVN